MKRIIITPLLFICLGISGLFGQSVDVISPNGGELLSSGTTYTIQWVSYGSSSNVDLYYSTDGGTSWIFIADNLPVSGTYAWLVPNVSSTTCLVKAQSIYVDQSNGYFTIGTFANSVTVTSPNGGEVLSPGSSHYITWSTTGSISNVEIYLSTDSGSTWSYIDDYAFNDGIYEWTVPAIATTTALIKINDVSNSSTYDISNSTFEISSVASSA